MVCALLEVQKSEKENFIEISALFNGFWTHENCFEQTFLKGKII